MHVNIIACLLAAGFFVCLTTLDSGSGISAQERFSHEKEVPASDQVGGSDAYKVAVLLSIGIAILSLIL
jgi:hypothetical protein